MQKSNKITCEQVEKIFINQKIDHISEEEKQVLITHLHSCEFCKHHQLVCEKIHNSMDIEQNSELIPKPEIRENLVNKMKANQPEKSTTLGYFLNNLKSVFSYRIPVYQAAVGIISMFLIFFALEKLPSKDRLMNPSEKIFIQNSDLHLTQTNILDSLDILSKQKIGLNVSEDTVFTKYINASM